MGLALSFAPGLARVEEWAVRRLDRMAAALTRKKSEPPHLETGLRGEREAYFHLRRLGYTVVARRWTTAKVRGDLDLVAWSGAVLCFAEVKSRSSRDIVAAEAAVDRAKRMQLRRLASAYLKSFPEEERGRVNVRFDVVTVYLSDTRADCEVLEDAFGWSE